ncbi:MAG TPA: GSCFA domain-containing protein [Ideonella sp.]|uniref:GSCFA domain-containing protein n=1 Tax=Ideonella sp. TaxID=1929293 RepID=UPI002C0E5E3E|nr:GSCFA domain-containing protein [Ideonella sp.]HSI51483.1 GSCFA domain-containing protein [Ideonella sp.]
MLEIPGWYRKKWSIADATIATAGSCFAQHIGRFLKQSGFNFLDVEPPPRGLRKDRWLGNGYGMYSARFGNVYTSRQLLQLLKRATGDFTPKEAAWEKDGGVVDPFRPTIEMQPFGSVAELEASRKDHLAAVARMFEQADVFVFTLGLTEGWISEADGAAFPICPGTHGGAFDAAQYRFANLQYPAVCQDLETFMTKARKLNPNMRFLYTVSPVPLTATATDQQVVVASCYSKSVLRAVAGHLAQKYDHVDYFPSFEIISSHVMRGTFYAPDMRTVVEPGVAHVMAQFFSEHVPSKKAKVREQEPAEEDDPDDIACDEVLLEAFGEQP